MELWLILFQITHAIQSVSVCVSYLIELVGMEYRSKLQSQLFATLEVCHYQIPIRKDVRMLIYLIGCNAGLDSR